MVAAFLEKESEMEPVFAPPPGIVATIPSRDAFIAFLEQNEVNLASWKNADEDITEYWQEIENNDTVYTVCPAYGSRTMPVRFLITIAVWVKTELRLRGGKTEQHVLMESIRSNDAWYPRKHADTSVSEKCKLDCLGNPIEEAATTIRRCLVEEVRLSVHPTDIRAGLQFRPYSVEPTSNQPLRIDGSQGVEVHVHEKQEKQPGLIHCNQIARYLQKLPDKYHFLGTRLDVATRYRSWWTSAHETSAQLDPIPNDLILQR